MTSTAEPGIWQHVDTGDFTGWPGLPADADYAEFDARFPRLVDGEARGMLGSSFELAYYTVHVAQRYPQHLKAWRQDTRLVLVEATLPNLATSPADLTAALGEPATRLNYHWDVLTVPEGAHVYPDRGITVCIGPEGQVLRLSLFTPCELDSYLRTRHHESRLIEQEW
ncbi:hypothetical protein ACQPZF_12645 [Actinosynnema sp. CS-041913]|uniref:hypothetical protein n=1 Tax=Actinosynnema sp. CS-041913 TaxID=3239917 RepID=UPI003D8D8AEF